MAPKVSVTGEEYVTHAIRMPPWKWFRSAFLTVVLLPLRVFFLLIVVGTAGLSQEEVAQAKPLHPVTGWRRRVQKLLIVLGRFGLFAAGFRIKVRGKRVSRHLAPILVAAPHSTFFDGLAVIFCDLPYIVSREENKDIPIFGRSLQFCQAIFVKREDPVSRSAAANEIKRRAQSSDDAWRQVMIFPEGSCSNRQALLAFKPGAFFPGKPVQPIVLRYPNATDTVTWTWKQSHGIKSIMWLTLTQVYTNVEVEFLPIYSPSFMEMSDPHLYARNVSSIMARTLGVPKCSLTFEDIKRHFDHPTTERKARTS